MLLLLAFVSILSPACIVASDEGPRGTAVRLATATPAGAAAAPTVALTTAAPPATQAAASTAAPAATPGRTSLPAATSGAVATPPGGQSADSYTVQPGDTLFGLSRTTGVPVAEIARANGIPPDSQLRTGQILQIPSLGSSNGPAIRVSSPQGGARVRSPILVQGTAAVFEGVVNIEVLGSGGIELARASTTANQPDAGQPGPFSVEVPLAGASGERQVTVRVFWRSPRDGMPMDEVRIPVTLVG